MEEPASNQQSSGCIHQLLGKGWYTDPLDLSPSAPRSSDFHQGRELLEVFAGVGCYLEMVCGEAVCQLGIYFCSSCLFWF